MPLGLLPRFSLRHVVLKGGISQEESKKSGPFDNWHNVKPYQKDGELMQKEGLCFPVLECLTSGLQ